MTPTTPEAEENLKPCLSADIQPKSHLPPGVWRQPKDAKDWGEDTSQKTTQINSRKWARAN